AVPPIPGLADVDFIHPGNWLRRRVLPSRLAIIGSGAVGLEMAQFYRRMGSAVTQGEHGHGRGSPILFGRGNGNASKGFEGRELNDLPKF
ncbi:MAG: FAD-dependent oxidoreductase, partial [Hyphomicrobium sp.]|nr:FAD-dependent oxidoreductase [Hyphomicrobium sp.]